jgi:phage gp45-like
MLNSSAKPAPLKGADANDEKGFFTRSKMRVHFNDNSKTITIDTPAGNSVVLDEQGTKIEIQDQNSNKITMDSNGIILYSPKDLEIKADGDIKISAGVKLEIAAKKLTMSSDTNMKLSAALTKVESSGVTEISGSMVKIN